MKLGPYSSSSSSSSSSFFLLLALEYDAGLFLDTIARGHGGLSYSAVARLARRDGDAYTVQVGRRSILRILILMLKYSSECEYEHESC